MKGYLAEGIVNEHKVLIVDPDTYREREYWLKFLPAVYKVKDVVTGTEEESKKSDGTAPLKVAWRYNTLLEGGGNAGSSDERQQ